MLNANIDASDLRAKLGPLGFCPTAPILSLLHRMTRTLVGGAGTGRLEPVPTW
jgi:hypothetical protein